MEMFIPLFAQDDAAGGIAALISLFCSMIIPLAFAGLVIAGMWKIFEKAGEQGWMALVPILNLYILTKISGRDILWFVLTLVPCINIVALVLIWIDVAKKFGQGAGFGLGLAFLTPIFVPMLGFGSARYNPSA